MGIRKRRAVRLEDDRMLRFVPTHDLVYNTAERPLKWRTKATRGLGRPVEGEEV
jgi:hypothetical protein